MVCRALKQVPSFWSCKRKIPRWPLFVRSTWRSGASLRAVWVFCRLPTSSKEWSGGRSWTGRGVAKQFLVSENFNCWTPLDIVLDWDASDFHIKHCHLSSTGFVRVQETKNDQTNTWLYRIVLYCTVTVAKVTGIVPFIKDPYLFFWYLSPSSLWWQHWWQTADDDADDDMMMSWRWWRWCRWWWWW